MHFLKTFAGLLLLYSCSDSQFRGAGQPAPVASPSQGPTPTPYAVPPPAAVYPPQPTPIMTPLPTLEAIDMRALATPKPAGLSVDEGRQATSLKFSQDMAFDGIGSLTLDFKAGVVVASFGDSRFNALTARFMIQRRGGQVTPLEVRNGTPAQIPDWTPACGAAPRDWQTFTMTGGNPSDRKNPPTTSARVEGTSVIFTWDDAEGGRPGLVKFPNFDFGLKYSCP